MNGDQLRSCIPSRLLMASESTCSAAEDRFLGCCAGCFPLPKSSLHIYGSPIDSEHDDDYPAESGFVL